MLGFSDRTSFGVLLTAFVIIQPSLTSGLTADVECHESTCEQAANSYIIDNEASDSELYLLQRQASIIKNSEKESRSLSKDHITTGKSLYNDAFTTVKQHALNNPECKLKPYHSRASAFVTAARARVVPLSQKQRLSMLSTMEASGLSDSASKASILACSLACVLTCAAFVVLMIVEAKYGRLVGDIVQQGMNTVAEDILGLDVTVSSMRIGVFQGSIILTDLKIANPPKCKNECFLTASAMDVRLNLWRYAWQRYFGRDTTVVVDALTLKDVNLHVEKSLESSNVEDILETVDGKKVWEQSLQDLLRSGTTEKKASRAMKRGEDDCRFTLRRMTILAARATVPSRGHVAIPALHCADFDKATEGKAKAIRPIVGGILREFCQTVS